MGNRSVHFSAYWNPLEEFDPLAPRGMKLWAMVLERCPEEERYAWYGKLSVSGRLGIDPSEIPELNRRIEKQNERGETHLYLYTSGHTSGHQFVPNCIHVGRVLKIVGQDQVNLDDPHVPTEFYVNMRDKNAELRSRFDDGNLIPFWFRLTDIRPLEWDRHVSNLESLYPDSAKPVPFDPMDRLSPLKVFEKIPQEFFKEPEKNFTEHWRRILEDDFWEPGQFRSSVVRRTYAEALKYAALRVPILILGERGTGKTRLAWWIRLNSKYKALGDNLKIWPQIACGQFKKSFLLQSELFGHRKGSFTGATEDRPGILARLHKDTLFLDEIGDIDRYSQRELIKALEERSYRKVGSAIPEESDFRLITATNKPPLELAKKLDEDFLDRITDVVLHMPPLREMRDDMPWLWKRTFERTRKDMDPLNMVRDLDEKENAHLLELLRNHRLPGNFRDLRRVAVHLVGALNNPRPVPIMIDELVEKALAWSSMVTTAPTQDNSRRVAAAFAADGLLDHSGSWDYPLDLSSIVKEFDRELKSWLGWQVRRIARLRGAAEKEICSKPRTRGLEVWRKGRAADEPDDE